jgi:urease accessory protein
MPASRWKAPEKGMSMETISGTVGHETDEAIAQRLHRLDHHGLVERVYVSEPLIGRRRFRVTGDRGNEYGIVLDGDPADLDGRVVLLTEDRAVVLHRGEPRTLTLRATDLAGAVQLGWHAGHLHWRVRFEGDQLVVLLDAPESDYLDRIEGFLASGAIEVVGP